MAILNRKTLKSKFILLIPALFILMASWKKADNANAAELAKTVKKGSTLILAVLKTTRTNTNTIVITGPLEITAAESQIHAKAQLQAYMDSLIISTTATIGLRHGAKTVIDNNTLNGQRPKSTSSNNKAANVRRTATNGAAKGLLIKLPPDMPTDPDL